MVANQCSSRSNGGTPATTCKASVDVVLYAPVIPSSALLCSEPSFLIVTGDVMPCAQKLTPYETLGKKMHRYSVYRLGLLIPHPIPIVHRSLENRVCSVLIRESTCCLMVLPMSSQTPRYFRHSTDAILSWPKSNVKPGASVP